MARGDDDLTPRLDEVPGAWPGSPQPTPNISSRQQSFQTSVLGRPSPLSQQLGRPGQSDLTDQPFHDASVPTANSTFSSPEEKNTIGKVSGVTSPNAVSTNSGLVESYKKSEYGPEEVETPTGEDEENMGTIAPKIPCPEG